MNHRNQPHVPEQDTTSFKSRQGTTLGSFKIDKVVQLPNVARKADAECYDIPGYVRQPNDDYVHRPESRNNFSTRGYNIQINDSQSNEDSMKTNRKSISMTAGNKSRKETGSQTEYSFKLDDNDEMIVRTSTSADDEHQPVLTYSDELFDSDNSGEELEPTGDQVSGRKKKQSKPADAANSEIILPMSPVSIDVTTSIGPAKNRLVSNTTVGIPPNPQVNVPANDKPVERTATVVEHSVATDATCSTKTAKKKLASDLKRSDSPRQPVKVPEILNLGDGRSQIKTLVSLALFDKYVVLATDSKLIRLERDSYVDIGSLAMGGYINAMCKIRRSSDIGVLIHTEGIVVISIDGSRMAVKYKLNTDKPFYKICHLTTYINEEPDPSYQFAVLLTTQSAPSATERTHEDKVGLIRAKPDTYDKQIPVPIYSVDYKELAISDHNVHSISGIGAFKWNRLLLSTPLEVVCLKIENGMCSTKFKWKMKLHKTTDIYCTKSQAYICIKGKVMMVDKKGRILVENILEGNGSASPDQISVCGDTVLLNLFDYTNWTSKVSASPALKVHTSCSNNV